MTQHSYLRYQAAPSEPWLSRVLSRRPRWLIAVVCAGLGLAAGAALFLLSPRVYEATTSVLVLPTTSGLDSAANGGRTITAIVMETEAELARSAQVAASASEALDGELSTAELLAQGTVTVPSNSQVLEFTVQTTPAELARDASMALAQSYLDRRSIEAERVTEEATSALRAQRQAAELRLQRLTQQRSTDPGEIALNQSRRDLLVSQLSDIDTQLLALSVQDTAGGQIISEAEVPSQPVSPVLLLTVGMGLLIGLALAAGLILVASRASPQSRESRRPLTHRQLRVLGTVPDPSQDDYGDLDQATLLRVCREVAAFPGEPGPIVLVGTGDPTARTKVALLLARAWATEFGESIIVVSDPAAAPALPKAARGMRGLVDILLSRATLSDCTTSLPGSKSTLIGPGDRDDLPSNFHSGHLLRFWSRLDREFGVVLVSASVEHEQPLGMMTLRTAGRVVMVVRDDETRDRDLRAVLEALDSLSAGDRLAGVVVVEPPGLDATGRGTRSITLTLAPDDVVDASADLPRKPAGSEPPAARSRT